MRGRRVALAVGVVGFVLLASVPAVASARARPAVFRVGAAVRRIPPVVPLFSGGFGLSPPIRREHDPVVQALVAAARAARRAYLQAATLDAGRLDTHVIDTDSYPGWANDGQLTVLRALAPRSRATIATFASVSVHGAHVRGDMARFFSADYFGWVARTLQRKLGGVAVV